LWSLLLERQCRKPYGFTLSPINLESQSACSSKQMKPWLLLEVISWISGKKVGQKCPTFFAFGLSLFPDSDSAICRQPLPILAKVGLWLTQ
jgi:hypothetical protein